MYSISREGTLSCSCWSGDLLPKTEKVASWCLSMAPSWVRRLQTRAPGTEGRSARLEVGWQRCILAPVWHLQSGRSADLTSVPNGLFATIGSISKPCLLRVLQAVSWFAVLLHLWPSFGLRPIRHSVPSRHQLWHQKSLGCLACFCSLSLSLSPVHSLSGSLSLSLFLSLSLSYFVTIFVLFTLSLSLYLSFFLSFFLSFSLSLFLSVSLSLSLYLRLTLWQSLYLGQSFLVSCVSCSLSLWCVHWLCQFVLILYICVYIYISLSLSSSPSGYLALLALPLSLYL